MKNKPLSLLWVQPPPQAHRSQPAFEPAAALAGAGWLGASADDAGTARQYDAVVYTASNRDELLAITGRTDLPQAAFETAVVVIAAESDEAAETTLLMAGVQAIVSAADTAVLMRALRHAVVRKAAERAARTAYATDLSTGLPHQAQLIEHMTQLLALREREPVPMVLLVLRMHGHVATTEKLGAETANILRRKVAVRLRSLLRASDVVAAIGPDAFGVLLGRLEDKGDGERVAAKLLRHLQQPVVAAGQSCRVLVSVGMALYPDQGRDAETLLKRASAQAGSVASPGNEGPMLSSRRDGAPAANDDGG